LKVLNFKFDIFKAEIESRSRTEAIERDNNMTGQPFAQLTVSPSLKELRI